MNRHIKLPLPFVLIIAMILPSTLLSDSKRMITETDLFKFNWIADPQISPDGKQLAFIRSAEKEGKPQPPQIYLLAFGGSISHKPVQSYTQPDLFVAEPGAAPKNLTAPYDFDIGGGIGGDQRAPRGGRAGGVIWSKDDRHLYVNVADTGERT